jgi:hypothetical protein
MQRLTRHAPELLLAGALAAAGVLLLVLTSHLTFYADTWEFLMNRRDFTADALLQPHNEHIVVIPVLIEQILLRVFGMASARPEYVLLTLALLATAALVYVYVERRVGRWLALFAAVLLLFLGPAWEVLLWPFEIGFAGSLLFGLAMLLALERNDRRGDVAAATCLTLSLGFSSLGIPFVVAAVVATLQGDRALRRRRACLLALPVILYAGWYLGWGHNAESHISVRNLLASPRFVAEAVAVALGSLFGLGNNPTGGAADPVWGRSLLIAMVVLFGYRQLRKPGFSPGIWPVAAAAATNWFLTAFNQMPGRDPTASRYQYAGAIFILLLLANLLQGVRPSRRLLIAGALLTAAAVGPNLVVLKDSRDFLHQQSVLTRADTAAIEISRRTEDPDFQLTPEVAGTPVLVDISAAKYLEAVDEYGSPAYSPAELASAPEEGRRQADIVLSKALPISTATKLGSGGQPAGGRCVTLRGGATSQRLEVPLRAGRTTVYVAPGPPATLALRRFAVDEFPVALEGGYGGSSTVLAIPRDTSPRPWYLHVEARQPARVCG